MNKNITLGMLDPSCAFEVVPNQDVNTCIRFTLPIPNWLDDEGWPKFNHPAFKDTGNQGSDKWRFPFFNYVDRCEQGVKIDGTGIIIFVAPTLLQSERLVEIIESQSKNLDNLTPWDVEKILYQAKEELGLIDRYNDNIKNCSYGLHPALPDKKYMPLFGPMLKNPFVSSVIYVSGKGAFIDGAAASPQIFMDGAFIFLPNVRQEEVSDAITRKRDGDKSVIIKLVQPDVFMTSRTLVNGNPIILSELPQFRRSSQYLGVKSPSP